MKISVIVPVYNSEKSVENTINSILNQTFKDFELIIIDDGSCDNSCEVCEKLSEKDERIKLFKQPNGGVSSARNLGIIKSKGDYIAFIDSDDLIANNYIEALYKNLRDNNAEMSVCGVDYIKNNIVDITTKDLAYNQAFTSEEAINLQPQNNLLLWGPWCKLISSKLIKQNKITFPKDIYNGEDIIFIAECLLKSNKVYIDSTPLYFYTVNENSSTSGIFTCKKATFFNAVEYMIDLTKTDYVQASNEWRIVHFNYAANTLTDAIRGNLKDRNIIGMLKRKLKANYRFYLSNTNGREKYRAVMLRYFPVLSTKLYWKIKV